ncbi:MAG: hypothetical protein ABI563_07020 [Specibacter sp.]
MTETADSSAPQGSEECTRVELPGPAFQPSEEEATREEARRPDLDQRQAAIRTERRPAGPEEATREERDLLTDEPPQNDDVPATDPAESSQE